MDISDRTAVVWDGGFLGLAVVNLFTYQALDVLTMLGFIILVGTVVNNAILIVHQTLRLYREGGLTFEAALRQAAQARPEGGYSMDDFDDIPLPGREQAP